MNRHILSKSTFIRGMQCPKSLYLHKKRPFLRDRLSPEQLAKFKRGTDVGVLARSLFPGGIDMSPRSPSQYQKKVAETQEALRNEMVDVIYEAVFQHDDTLIMLDILVRSGKQWKAYEVKSSRALSQTYYADAALQYYVLQGNGLALADFSLIYINQDYRLDGKLDVHALFKIEGVLEHVKDQVEFIHAKIYLLKEVLQLQKSPAVPVGWHCNKPYPCDFIGHCWKNIPKNNIFKLTAFDKALITNLAEKDQFTIGQTQNLLAENEIQKMQIKALINTSLTFDQEKLNQLIKPISDQEILFLKVLFHNPAVPYLQQTKPYQTLPLGMSWIDSSSQLSAFVMQHDNESFVLEFSQKLIAITKNMAHLITDDASGLINFIESAQKLMHPAVYDELSLLKPKIFGIRQALETSHFFHPDLSFHDGLKPLAGILLERNILLKDEVLLFAELQAASQNDPSGLPAEELSLYVSTIKQVFKKIQQLSLE